jgi:hypothetical protein
MVLLLPDRWAPARLLSPDDTEVSRHPAASFLIATAIAASCTVGPDEVSAYQLWVRNDSPTDQRLVVTNGMDGLGVMATYEIPADGLLRQTGAIAMRDAAGSDPDTALVFVFDDECRLTGRITLTSGWHQLVITRAGTTELGLDVAAQARPVGAPFTDLSDRTCDLEHAL